LYIASTPHDFYAERQHLLKQVIPRLRTWCENRKIQLVEIDLQWGAAATSSTESLALRMRELRRCREENIHPFFLCLLSQMYGPWVPSRGSLKAELVEEYGCIEGFSQTAMEIVYGSYVDANPNAYFALRDPNFLDSVPEIHKAAFEDEAHTNEVRILKDRIERRFAPTQLLRYRVEVDKESSSEQLAMIGLDGEFLTSIAGFFKSRISAQYPVAEGEIDIASMERRPHAQFVALRGETLYGRDEIRSHVLSYVASAENGVRLVTRGGGATKANTAFGLYTVQCLLTEFLAEQNLPVLVLEGEPGAGKSVLVAACAQQTKALLPHLKVFYHFVGAAPGSTDLVRLLRRMAMELAPAQPILDTEEELVRDTPALLKRAGREGGIAIFVDAINQLDEDALKSQLSWLPSSLPPGVRCVVSAITQTEGHQMLCNRAPSPVRVPVTVLTQEASQQIVRDLLARYHRSIDGDHIKQLLTKGGSKNPLWLVTACEELRVHPSVATVGEKIASFADTLLGILQQVLGRFEKEHGTLLVAAALCFLECSRHGLLETELLALLADEKQYVTQDQSLRELPDDSTSGEASNGEQLKAKLHEQAQTAVQNELTNASSMGGRAKDENENEPDTVREEPRLAAAKWSPIYHALRPFLRPCGEPGEGRLDFYHRAVSKAVRLKYLTKCGDGEEQDRNKAMHSFLEHEGSAEKDAERYTFWHGHLADYFERCRDAHRRAEELPYHLEMMLDNSRLLRCILDWHTFDRLRSHAHKHELMRVCRVVGGYAVFSAAAVEQLKIVENDNNTDQMLERKCAIGRFLAEVGQYVQAISVLEAVVRECRDGENPVLLASITPWSRRSD
jgi:hypothetical protein